MVIPVLVTISFGQDAEGVQKKKRFMRLFADKVADTAEFGFVDVAFYGSMAFYPLDPRDRDVQEDEDQELISSRPAKIGGARVALPIQHELAPNELLSLLQQEFDWVVDINGAGRCLEGEKILDWEIRIVPRARHSKAPPPGDEAPGDLRWDEPGEWATLGFRYLIVADTTTLYRGFVTTAIFLWCDIVDLWNMISGEVRDIGDPNEIRCKHRLAAHYLGKSSEWCRDHAIGAVRMDAQSLDCMWQALENTSADLEHCAENAWRQAGVDGAYVLDGYEERFLEHAAASLDVQGA